MPVPRDSPSWKGSNPMEGVTLTTTTKQNRRAVKKSQFLRTIDESKGETKELSLLGTTFSDRRKFRMYLKKHAVTSSNKGHNTIMINLIILVDGLYATLVKGPVMFQGLLKGSSVRS